MVIGGLIEFGVCLGWRQWGQLQLSVFRALSASYLVVVRHWMWCELLHFEHVNLLTPFRILPLQVAQQATSSWSFWVGSCSSVVLWLSAFGLDDGSGAGWVSGKSPAPEQQTTLGGYLEPLLSGNGEAGAC